MEARTETSEGRGQGEGLLARISTEMVRALKQYYGKGPERAKSYMLDDFLLVVMRGGILRSERTMLESGDHESVRDFRQRFENEMANRLTDMIEDLTGRTVINYQSQVLFDPDIVIEIFFFDRDVEAEQIQETAHAQLGDAPTGEVRSEDVP